MLYIVVSFSLQTEEQRHEGVNKELEVNFKTNCLRNAQAFNLTDQRKIEPK